MDLKISSTEIITASRLTKTLRLVLEAKRVREELIYSINKQLLDMDWIPTPASSVHIELGPIPGWAVREACGLLEAAGYKLHDCLDDDDHVNNPKIDGKHCPVYTRPGDNSWHINISPKE